MFNVLKRRMSPENYNALLNDYELLYHNKICGQWNKLYSLKKDANIFCKSLFNQLHDKYQYLTYKQIVKNDKSVHALLQALLLSKGIYAAFIVELHYLSEIYISFLIEDVIKQELKDNNIKIISNNHLDIIKKIDMMIEDKPIQVKNYSFLESNQYLDNRLNIYKQIDGICFIFYTLCENNVCIKRINNKVLIPIEEINANTANLKSENITVDEAIKQINENKTKEKE